MLIDDFFSSWKKLYFFSPGLCNSHDPYVLQYIACQTLLQANEIELLAPKGVFQFDNDQLSSKSSTAVKNPDLMSLVINSCREDSMQILKAEETLGEMKGSCTSIKDQLVSFIQILWDLFKYCFLILRTQHDINHRLNKYCRNGRVISPRLLY